MKTQKKLQRYAITYGILLMLFFIGGFLSIFLFENYLGFLCLIPIWVLFKGAIKSKKTILLSDFQNHLESKVKRKDWPIEAEFPMQERITQWINEYDESINNYLSAYVWSRIGDEKTSQGWNTVLSNVSIQVIGLNHGISLFELYYLEAVHVDKADFAADTCHELEKTRMFLEYMPVQDLTVYVFPPIHLTVASLYYLMIRDEKIGNFNEVCLSLMKSSCEIIAPMDVVEQLISETNAVVPVVFPQRFLAYLIKMEEENQFNVKPDSEKRKKVFDWYMSQAVQEFDFYSYWPKFTEEELEYVLAKFEGDSVKDEIFVVQQDWKHVSTARLKVIYRSFINNPRNHWTDEFLLEALNRM